MKKSLIALALMAAASLAFAVPTSPPASTAPAVAAQTQAQEKQAAHVVAVATPQVQVAFASAAITFAVLPGDLETGCGRGLHPIAGKGKGGGKKPPKCIEAGSTIQERPTRFT